MTLSPAFVQAVREGRIAELTIDRNFWDNLEFLYVGPEAICHLDADLSEIPNYDFMKFDHLCAHLRRWMEGKGIGIETVSKWGRAELRLFDNGSHDSTVFAQESELDRHVEAALWVLGREG